MFEIGDKVRIITCTLDNDEYCVTWKHESPDADIYVIENNRTGHKEYMNGGMMIPYNKTYLRLKKIKKISSKLRK